MSEGAALDVTVFNTTQDGMAAVSFDEVPEQEPIMVPRVALNKRYVPPVFNVPEGSPVRVTRRFEFADGAIQVAVLMPPDMDVDDLRLALTGRQNKTLAVGEAVMDERLELTLATAFKLVEDQ